MRTLSRKWGLYWRPLAPKETDFEFLFLVVSSGLASSCYLWLTLGMPWPGCWVRRLTGLPCPTCGATRCAMSLAHGDLIAAWRHNPLIFLCYGGTLLVNLYAAAVLLFRLPRVRLANLPAKVKRVLGALFVFALTANWIYLLANR
jgi:Protein of unknown function (DUF2752)